MQFRQTIHSCWGALLVFTTWCVIWIASKHIIRTDVNEQSTHLFHGNRKILWCCGIKLLRQFLIALCCIYVGICRTIDDDLHVLSLHQASDIIEVGDVEYRGFLSFYLNDISKYVFV